MLIPFCFIHGSNDYLQTAFKMKASAILCTLLTASATAWKLDFHDTKGHVLNTHGGPYHEDGCENIKTLSTISSLKFMPEGDASTYTVYTGADCKGRGDTFDAGVTKLKHKRHLRSYKMNE